MADYYKVNATDTRGPHLETGITPFDVTVELSATQAGLAAGAVFNLLKMPEKAFIVNSAGWEYDFTDMDTNGAPALVLDIQFSASADGSSPDVVINNSSAGQSGASDAHDASEEWTDVGGKYLQAQVVTQAATAAAGSIRVKGFIACGVNPFTIDLSDATAVAI